MRRPWRRCSPPSCVLPAALGHRATEPVPIQGLAELQRALQRLPREVQGVVAADALRAGAAVIEAGAKRRAAKKTGKLAAGIATIVTLGSGGLIAQIAT